MYGKRINIKIRKCTSEDYNIIIDIWEKAGLKFKPLGRDSREKMAAEMERGVGTFFIGEIDDKPAGCILATHDGRKGWINRVAVDPEYRRLGIATALIRHAEKHLENLGMEIITCLIEDWNKSSMELFLSLGYVKHDDIIYFSKRKNDDV
ncbi:GNAT family N-acetyltransferase [bacterium]|nr:GNAT family N-acetyltransferase [bacterium]